MPKWISIDTFIDVRVSALDHILWRRFHRDTINPNARPEAAREFGRAINLDCDRCDAALGKRADCVPKKFNLRAETIIRAR